jgi:hypothetical protein
MTCQARAVRPGVALLVACGVAIGLACGLTACSSTPSGSPAGSSATTSAAAAPTADQAVGRRLAEAPALLVQCALDRGTIKGSSVPSSLGHGGQIDAAVGGSLAFAQWYSGGTNGTVIGGQNLAYWVSWAATHDTLPAAVCGASASAAKMASRLFPGAPAAWGS